MSDMDIFRSDKKLCSHKEWVYRYIDKGHHYPITLEIDPTNECPLKCSFCNWAGRLHTDESNASLSPAMMLNIIRQAAELGVKSIIWTGGGEPLQNRAVLPAIQLASELGMKNGMFTTGLPMTSKVSEILVEHLSWVRFHIDGATPFTYAKVHGTSENMYSWVVGNIGEFVAKRAAVRSGIKAGIGSVALPENITELPRLARLSKDLGLDYFQYKHDLTQMNDTRYLRWWNTEVIPVLDSLSREIEDDSFCLQYSRGNDYTVRDPSRRCHVHHLNTAITADGRVTYCKSLRHMHALTIGNIHHQSLEEIFDSERHRRLSRKITPSSCGVLPCPYHRTNFLLEKLSVTRDLSKLVPVPSIKEHQNFI